MMKRLLILWIFFVIVLIAISLKVSCVFYRNIDSKVVGVVLPHHDMVATARQAYLAEISNEVTPRTIVLLSPDHFQTTRSPITVSNKVWKTSLGDILPDFELIEALPVTQNDANFEGEHGITTLLRDIKQYFPDSLLVPVMISQQASYQKVSDFVSSLYRECSDCLLIASVDFSHTNHANVAVLHDALTLRELYNASSTALYDMAEVDSPQSLAALAIWANLQKAKKFNLFSHTNSGYITNTLVGEMTTHIIGGYKKGMHQNDLANTITMMFGGDVMFARDVFETHKYNPALALTSHLGERFFWGVDFSLVNFEGVFTKSDRYNEGWNDYPPKLRFHPVFLLALESARLKGVSLSNNHTHDDGEVGYQYTKDLLKQKGIFSLTNATAADFIIKEVRRNNLAAVVISIATHRGVMDITKQIKQYDSLGYQVIIFPHWGEEYSTIPSSDQVAMAKDWIDAGADLIVGNHPHVVQNVGLYQGVPIIYSLGNLLFDQYVPEATAVGIVLGLEISAAGQKLFIIPVKSYLKPQILEYDFGEQLKAWENNQVDNYLGDVFYFPKVSNR